VEREALLLILLRDRLTFVLRDGAATHAAADTPAPQRALLPRALPKQQARPPWAQTTGLVACIFEAKSCSTNVFVRTHCGARAVQVRV
jgi:hypothetical protein